MVVCAVRCEPVSMENSLLSGNLIGNFAKFGSLGRIQAEIAAAAQALVREFPKKENREFFRSNREFRSDNREFASLGTLTSRTENNGEMDKVVDAIQSSLGGRLTDPMGVRVIG
jgi:hypothetical protein